MTTSQTQYLSKVQAQSVNYQFPNTVYPTDTNSPNYDNNTTASGDSNNVGIIVGVIVALIVVAVIAIAIYAHRRSQQNETKTNERMAANTSV